MQRCFRVAADLHQNRHLSSLIGPRQNRDRKSLPKVAVLAIQTSRITQCVVVLVRRRVVNYGVLVRMCPIGIVIFATWIETGNVFFDTILLSQILTLRAFNCQKLRRTEIFFG